MAVSYNYAGPRIVDDGLVLYLDAANPNSYNLSTPLTWRDISGNRNNGTLINGTAVVSTTAGNVMSFDGSNDYVNFSNILNFERTDSFSFNCWVNLLSLSVYRIIIAKMDSSFKGYAFVVETNGQVAFILRNTSTTNSLLVRSSSSLVSVNTWINISVTYNGNSLPSGVSFYVNSTLYSNSIINNTLSQTTITTYPLNIGARTSISDGFFSGNIANLQIYNRALSQAEITQNYNATKGRFGL